MKDNVIISLVGAEGLALSIVLDKLGIESKEVLI